MNLQSFINWAGFVIGVISSIISWFIYVKSKETKEPKCVYRTYREIHKLSQHHDTEIKVFYKSDEVDRVYTTYVWFWNKGRKPVRNSDIPSEEGLVLKIIDENLVLRILDFKLLKTSRKEINFSIKHMDSNSLSISFDFLDHNDGAVIEIQHTGSTVSKVEIEGVILGVTDGVKSSNLGSDESRQSRSRQLIMRRFLNLGSRPRRFVKRSKRKKLIETLISFLIIAVFLGLVFILDSIPNTIVSPEENKLRAVLIEEIPNITPQNIKTILKEAGEESGLTKNGGIFIGILFALLWVLLVLAIWLENYPFPGSLHFDKEKMHNGNQNG